MLSDRKGPTYGGSVFVGRRLQVRRCAPPLLENVVSRSDGCRTVKARPTGAGMSRHRNASVFVGRCLQVRHCSPTPFENIASRGDGCRTVKARPTGGMSVFVGRRLQVRRCAPTLLENVASRRDACRTVKTRPTGDRSSLVGAFRSDVVHHRRLKMSLREGMAVGP